MRVALVYIPSGDPQALEVISKAMSKAFEAAGHFVDLSQARPDESPHLTGYDYIVIGTESASAFGKIPPLVATFLSQAGMVGGKRSMAFLRKSGLKAEKALTRLMGAMEAEGMIVTSAEVVTSEESAIEAARGAPVERR
jgi:hypothetical protein